jgi:hypothetical protein
MLHGARSITVQQQQQQLLPLLLSFAAAAARRLYKVASSFSSGGVHIAVKAFMCICNDSSCRRAT